MAFRKFITESGKEVIAGKSAETNEELIKQIEGKSIILHTKEKGSPFAEIKQKKGEKISKKDIYEAGVFCSVYSQDWKKNKKDVIMHIFSGKDIFKDGKMKAGTFGVKDAKAMRIKKEDIENFQGKLFNDLRESLS